MRTEAILLIAWAAQAQSFDVTSVKPSKSTAYWTTVAPSRSGRFSAKNITVKELLAIAYKIEVPRISGGPGWLESDRFDVEGRAGDRTADKDLQPMLQALLAERFALKVHNETKVLSGYGLVVGKGGPKMQAVDRNCPADGKAAAGCSGIRFVGRGITAEAASMAGLARYLSGMLQTTVTDETGLKGKYDFKLEWVPESPDGGGSPMDWIYSAIPQQLGLRLEARKGSAGMLVIDRIERPTAN